MREARHDGLELLSWLPWTGSQRCTLMLAAVGKRAKMAVERGFLAGSGEIERRVWRKS